MDMYVIARLKSSYEKWERFFSSDPLSRSSFCDASRTTIRKIGEKAALIALFDVDKDKLSKHVSGEVFRETYSPFVEKHEIYGLNPGFRLN